MAYLQYTGSNCSDCSGLRHSSNEHGVHDVNVVEGIGGNKEDLK